VPNVPIPYKKLHTFRQWLGLTEDELKKLEPLKDSFINRKDDFAGYFHDLFMNIPEAKLIIDHERTHGYLLQAWANWFVLLFSRGLDEEFLGYLWRVGMKHVEINLDKRFSNIGFSIVRQFCQEVVRSELPLEKTAEVLRVIDKLVDFCLLVETDAYLATTTRCDAEIIKGVADRIRNPVVVIGGNVSRLMKHVDVKDPVYPIYNFIFSQSKKCDRMVRDIKTYMEVYEREPLFEPISLEGLLNEILEALFAGGRYVRPGIEMDIAPDASHIFADRNDMNALFVHLLENSLEALPEKDPLIRISSNLESASPHSLNIVIFNSGTPIKEEDMEQLFSSFFTTKPGGTGFGLAIARQAARKNMGRLSLWPVKEEGTKVTLSLPRYE
jgi:signal transduction histidine kinase